MRRGIPKKTNCLCNYSSKPVKIVGVMCSKRKKDDCAREDPISNEVLRIALKEAEKNGAKVEILDLRELKINPCKECYSSCPAQCRFNEKEFQCDCYRFKHDALFLNSEKFYPIEEAYDKLDKKKFFELYNDEGSFAHRDDMWKVYKAFMEADGIIFATSTIFYGRNPLLQTMFSRLCALDGGVEELWGDGKNLGNSIKYARNPKSLYKQRLYDKKVAFINISKEGDVVTPNLMKACIMIGMEIIPLGVAYNAIGYKDPTHRSDARTVLNDKFTISLAKHIGKTMVDKIRCSDRKYGMLSSVV